MKQLWIRSLFGIGLAIALTGCATYYEKENVVTNELRAELGGEIFQPVVLQLNTLSGTGNYYVFKEFLPQIREKIITSGLFQHGMRGYEDQVTLNVYWESKHNDSALLMILRSATLFLVPAQADVDHWMKFEIVRGGQILKTFEYKQNVKYIHSIFTENAATQKAWFDNGVNLILRKFFVDLKKDGVLSVRQTGKLEAYPSRSI